MRREHVGFAVDICSGYGRIGVAVRGLWLEIRGLRGFDEWFLVFYEGVKEVGIEVGWSIARLL